jgi:hypothetical protein
MEDILGEPSSSVALRATILHGPRNLPFSGGSFAQRDGGLACAAEAQAEEG